MQNGDHTSDESRMDAQGEASRVTIELTPYMLERVNKCRDHGETLESCLLDLLWIGVLNFDRTLVR